VITFDVMQNKSLPRHISFDATTCGFCRPSYRINTHALLSFQEGLAVTAAALLSSCAVYDWLPWYRAWPLHQV